MATINDETYIIWGDEENGYEINEMKTKNYLKEFQKLLSTDLSKREIQELLTDVEEGLQTDGMFYFNFSNEQGYDSFVGVCVKKKYRQLKQMLKDMRDEFMSSLDESCGNNLSKKSGVLKNLSEANKYFFGTGSTKEVKKLFESSKLSSLESKHKRIVKEVVKKINQDRKKKPIFDFYSDVECYYGSAGSYVYAKYLWAVYNEEKAILVALYDSDDVEEMIYDYSLDDMYPAEIRKLAEELQTEMEKVYFSNDDED